MKQSEIYDEWARRMNEKNKPRFKDNGDGTVTDTTTGLMWLQDGKDYNYGNPQKWQIAIDGCKAFNFAGHKDWRLPTPYELFGIVDFTKKKYPLINDVFVCPNCYYWTAQEYVPGTTYAVIVHFNYGFVTSSYKTNVYYVRPVRGGSCNG